MRNIIFAAVATLSLTAQAISPHIGEITVPVQAQSDAGVTQNQNLTFDLAKPDPLAAKIAPAPNFDAEILIPLKAAQEKAALEAKKKKKAKKRIVSVPVATTGDALARLRYCEAGGIYNRNSGNGYFGAYQYSISTWNNYAGYARADLAPAEVQDAKATADIARRGYSPWPACSRKLGLR